MRRADSLEKTLMLGKIEGKRRREWQKLRWLDDITDSMDVSLSELRETVKNRKAWGVAVHGVTEYRTHPTHTWNCMLENCQAIYELWFQQSSSLYFSEAFWLFRQVSHAAQRSDCVQCSCCLAESPSTPGAPFSTSTEMLHESSPNPSSKLILHFQMTKYFELGILSAS